MCQCKKPEYFHFVPFKKTRLEEICSPVLILLSHYFLEIYLNAKYLIQCNFVCFNIKEERALEMNNLLFILYKTKIFGNEYESLTFRPCLNFL